MNQKSKETGRASLMPKKSLVFTQTQIVQKDLLDTSLDTLGENFRFNSEKMRLKSDWNLEKEREFRTAILNHE